MVRTHVQRYACVQQTECMKHKVVNKYRRREDRKTERRQATSFSAYALHNTCASRGNNPGCPTGIHALAQIASKLFAAVAASADCR